MTRGLTAGFVSGLVLGTAAHAANLGVIPTKLVVVDKLTTAGKAKTVYVSKDQAAGITKGASTDSTQISVQLYVVYGNGNASGTFALPAGASNGTDGWLSNKATVAKYVNKDAPGGPTQAKVAVVKPGKLLKLVGKGLGDQPLDIFAVGDPGAAGVQTAYCVTNEGEQNCHCSTFTGCAYTRIANGAGAKLVCKTGTGDGSCSAAAQPTTTITSTTTTTTTTTTTPGGCLSDTDCLPAGQICNESTCAPCTDGLDDARCGVDAACIGGACAVGACHSDAQCAPPNICLGLQCTCADSATCGGAVCVDGVCVPCSSDQQCADQLGPGHVCAGTGACIVDLGSADLGG